MTTYTIESVNGATCRHRATSHAGAAQLHVRRCMKHSNARAWGINRDGKLLPLDQVANAPGFFQAHQNAAPLGHGFIRQPFRVVPA